MKRNCVMGYKSCLSASALLAALMLTGCSTFDLKPDATVVEPQAAALNDAPPPQEWSVPAPDALPTTDWVRAFPDPKLIGLVDEALRENTNIGAAYARLDGALAREKISNAARLPSVSGSAGISRSERGNEFIPDTTNFSTGLNASWEPDFWGRIADDISISELGSEAAATDVASARLSITGQVAQTWFSLIETKLLDDLSLEEIKTQKRALNQSQRRFEAGLSSSADVRLTRSSLALAEATRASRRQRLASLSRQVEILLNRYPSGLIDSATDLPELPQLTGAGAPTYILTQRPDLIAAEQRLAAQGIEIDIARKALLPRLNLTSGLNAGGTSLKNFFDIDALVANIATNLTAPIFQGGRLRANVELQEAVLEQQLQSYIYTEGLASILQLLDAQTRRISAQGQLISARAERLQNRVRLHVALGGGAYGDVPPDALPAFLRDQGE